MPDPTPLLNERIILLPEGDICAPWHEVCQSTKEVPNFGEYPSLLKNPFAPLSAPSSGAACGVFVAFWSRFRVLLGHRPGRRLLFQHADPFLEHSAV